ncbi:MAG: GlsB/YeaQ/YmgE family stress response membrane protein [Cytophagales bacterium]|nr:GlsB/YeaQ/YmgE family stress response membrane protein [Cytophagales bacterium]
MSDYLWMLAIGLIVGFFAKHLLDLQLSIWMAILVGMVGSYVGGFMMGIFCKPADKSTVPCVGSSLMSVAGACIVLGLYVYFVK